LGTKTCKSIFDDLLAARTGVNAGNIRSMRRASAPTVLPDDVNRTKGSFGDPNNPLDFLNNLQQAVAAGIEEITGMDQATSFVVLKSKKQNKFQSHYSTQTLK
jgi:hypothetical protein